MNRTSTAPHDTETVVRHHLTAFVEQQGPDALLRDYADDACLLSEAAAYRDKPAIGKFFEAFLAGLPAGEELKLRSLRVEGEMAYITWSFGPTLPLGTDTFVVRDGKIVSQTFAMYAAPAR